LFNKLFLRFIWQLGILHNSAAIDSRLLSLKIQDPVINDGIHAEFK